MLVVGFFLCLVSGVFAWFCVVCVCLVNGFVFDRVYLGLGLVLWWGGMCLVVLLKR